MWATRQRGVPGSGDLSPFVHTGGGVILRQLSCGFTKSAFNVLFLWLSVSIFYVATVVFFSLNDFDNRLIYIWSSRCKGYFSACLFLVV